MSIAECHDPSMAVVHILRCRSVRRLFFEAQDESALRQERKLEAGQNLDIRR